MLPGQEAAPDGPVDLTPMWLMHHALRRDLANFSAAVRATPVSDRRIWQSLHQRWQQFARILHHHHSGEDAYIWPMLLKRVDDAGDAEGRATLDAMTAEHAEIDPLLDRCAEGFARLAERPDGQAHALLSEQLSRAGETLGQHLGHEERDAMALVQRYLSPADWHLLDKQVGAGYPAREVPFTLGWVMYGLRGEARQRALGFLGKVPSLMWSVLLRRRFERSEQQTFQYAGV
jgi:hypothetical protein